MEAAFHLAQVNIARMRGPLESPPATSGRGKYSANDFTAPP